MNRWIFVIQFLIAIVETIILCYVMFLAPITIPLASLALSIHWTLLVVRASIEGVTN